MRIQTVKRLQSEGKLDGDLRWMPAAVEASVEKGVAR